MTEYERGWVFFMIGWVGIMVVSIIYLPTWAWLLVILFKVLMAIGAHDVARNEDDLHKPGRYR